MAITKVIASGVDFDLTNTTKGLKMPTGTAFSGTPVEGMMRNDTDQSSGSSASTMQHYTGNNEWKNYRNQLPSYNITYLIVAGGGAGGGGGGYYNGGGGGGAGGYLTATVSQASGLTLNITVGAGGVGIQNRGNNGADSIVTNLGGSTITAAGGGGGAGQVYFSGAGADGGSGGGGETQAGASGGGTATPAGQGNDGGGVDGSYTTSGGGGGAGAAGSNATSSSQAGNGGIGLQNNITGTNVYYAGGGGGSGYLGFTAGTGGSGGGGAGAPSAGVGTAGTDGLGGGGGGSCFSGNQANVGGDGGDGVVILRMPTANKGTFSNATETTDGSDTILTFATGSGTYNS